VAEKVGLRPEVPRQHHGRALRSNLDERHQLRHALPINVRENDRSHGLEPREMTQSVQSLAGSTGDLG
jgi:hypothetical protein